MSLADERSYYHQPPPGSYVDLGHELGEECVGWWVPNQPGSWAMSDISGGNHHGKLTQMAPASDYVQGKFGGEWALDFDGINDYVSVPHHVSLNLTSAFTLVAQVYVPSAASIPLHTSFINKTSDADGNVGTYFFTASQDPVQMNFGFYTGAAWRTTGAYLLPEDQWNMVVGTYDGAALHLYLNSILLEGPTVVAGVPGIWAQPLVFGCQRKSVNRFFEGMVSLIAIYGRAFTFEQVKWLTAQPYAPIVTPKPRRAYWSIAGLQIGPTGIASGEAIGAHQLNLILAASGITSAEALGSPELALQILAAGIASAEAIGDPIVGLFVITPTGIVSAEAFGTTLVGVPPDGLLYVNIADKKLRLYADGAWHDVYAW